MSLKAFHIVFVVVSTLLMAFFAVWAWGEYTRSKSSTDLAFVVTALVGIVVLLVYGKWFMRKIKDRKLA